MSNSRIRLLAAAALLAIPAAALAASIVRDAFPSAGGTSTATGYRLDFSAGLPFAGSVSGNGYGEIAGFWIEPDPPVSDVPEGEGDRTVPAFTQLGPSYPNPFQSQAVLRFQIAGDAGGAVPVRLEVFDVTGRSVSLLVNESLAPGSYQSAWDRTSNGTGRVSNGIYFARLSTPSYAKTIRLVAAR